MNKLAQILGIQFSNEIEISSITNTIDKVKEGSIFFALKGTQNHGSKYTEEAFERGAKLAIHNDKNFYSSNENIIYVKDLQSSGGEKIFRVLEAFYKINNFNNQIKQNIDAKDFRRNIIISGINLNELINKKIKINEVTLIIHEICQPCKYLQNKLKIPDLVKMLVNKSGVRAEILSSGSLSVGDAIKILK